MHIATATFLSLSLAAASPNALAQSGEGPVVEARVDVPVTATLGAAWIASEVWKGQLVAPRCLWCDRDGLGRDTLNPIDREVRSALVFGDTSVVDTLSNLSGLVVAPVFALGGVALAAGRDGHLRDAWADMLLVAESAVVAADLNQTVKYFAMRERPFVHVLPAADKSKTPVPDDNNLSFFSGHTTLAFSLATGAGTVASMRSRRLAPLVWATGLTLAVATGYLRMAADKHYLSDVLVGAGVGSLIGWLVPGVLHRPRVWAGVSWTVVSSPGGMGLGGAF